METVHFADDVFSPIYRNLIKNQLQEIVQMASSLLPKNMLLEFISTACLPLLRRGWERVLILELNCAEQDGLLTGVTDEQRFSFFVQQMCKDENINLLLNKYPLLDKRWSQEIKIFCHSLKKMLERISHDIFDVALSFYQDNSSSLTVTEIKLMGDPHHGMQMTSRISFAMSNNKAGIVYYKPRDLSLDAALEKFIDWWNGRSKITHLVPENILRRDYGWSQSISYKACSNETEVNDFYLRYGSLLALSYIFSTRDLHMENIVSCGAYPVIVDIETLFSCLFEYEAKHPVKYHIYSSLLLPSHADDNMELSPLSAKEGRATEIEIWINPQQQKTSLKMEKIKFYTLQSKTNVRLNDMNINFMKYRRKIIEGYEESAKFIFQHKDEFLERISAFMPGCAVRILVRSTAEYSKILYNTWHPDSLYNSTVDRDINILSSDFGDPEILISEINELHSGDIPYFKIKFKSHELRNGQDVLIPAPVLASPGERIISQLNALSDAIIEQTKMDINFTFLAYTLREQETSRSFPVDHRPPIVDYPGEGLQEWYKMFMQQCLHELKSRAFIIDENYHWRHINIMEEQAVKASIQSLDLYNGTSGVALTYFYNGQKYNIPEYISFASVLKRQIAVQLHNLPAGQPGFYCGSIGVVYSLSLMYRNEIPLFLNRLEKELEKISYTLITTKYIYYSQLDIMNGVAGTLFGLIKISPIYKDFPVFQKIMSLARCAYEILKSHCLSLMNSNTLLGFSHGSAGVSYVMAEYMKFVNLNDDAAVAIIKHNISRENSFRTNTGWPDFSARDNCNASWCHGATGFGFSRMACREFINPSDFSTDMALIEKRLLDHQESFSLCHGLGASYFFAKRYGYDKFAMRILNAIRERALLSGYMTDFGLHDFEMIGAMNGVCGLFIGDALLYPE